MSIACSPRAYDACRRTDNRSAIGSSRTDSLRFVPIIRSTLEVVWSQLCKNLRQRLASISKSGTLTPQIVITAMGRFALVQRTLEL